MTVTTSASPLVPAPVAAMPTAAMSPLKARLERLLHSQAFQALVLAGLCFALFAHDLFLVFRVPLAYDPWIVAATLAVLALFAVEVVVSAVVVPGYFLGFYFWMDLLATVSLLFDVPSVLSFLGPGITGAVGLRLGSLGAARGAAARTARAARAAIRAARAVRVVKLFRHPRLPFSWQRHLRRQRHAASPGVPGAAVGVGAANGSGGAGGASVSVPPAATPAARTGAIDGVSRAVHVAGDGHLAPRIIADRFVDLSTRLMVLVILALLVVIPLVVGEDASDTTTRAAVALDSLETAPPAALASAVREFQAAYPTVFRIEVNGGVVANRAPDFKLPTGTQRSFGVGVRREEIDVITSKSGESVAYMDSADALRAVARGNLILTVFIVALVGIATWFFHREADLMLVLPIERLVDMTGRLLPATATLSAGPAPGPAGGSITAPGPRGEAAARVAVLPEA